MERGHDVHDVPGVVAIPSAGLGLGDIGDRKGLVIVRVTELVGDVAEPLPRIATDGVPAAVAPAAILRDRAVDPDAAIVGGERTKAARFAQRSDREVPAPVRGDQRAAVEHDAVADRPGGEQGDAGRAGEERLGQAAAQRAAKHQEQERPREQRLRSHEGARRQRDSARDPAEAFLASDARQVARQEHQKARQRLRHHQRAIQHQAGMQGDQDSRDAGSAPAEHVRGEQEGERRGQRADDRIGERRDRLRGAEHGVDRADERAVAHGIVRPGSAPNQRGLGVAVALGDAERTSMVERAVPDGLDPEGEHDDGAHCKRKREQRHGECQVSTLEARCRPGRWLARRWTSQRGLLARAGRHRVGRHGARRHRIGRHGLAHSASFIRSPAGSIPRATRCSGADRCGPPGWDRASGTWRSPARSHAGRRGRAGRRSPPPRWRAAAPR